MNPPNPVTGPLATSQTSLGIEDPDRLVGVPAGELDEWAWLIGRLAQWLGECDPVTAPDFTAGFHPRREPIVGFLEQISERMAALIDGRVRP